MMQKTNAMRLLDKAGIKYSVLTYTVDEGDLSGVHVAGQLGLPPGQVFKTLVLRGKAPFVCCIPSDKEIDLKKAAAAAGEKKAEMLPLKELTPLTGYQRGGCSPIGMKKALPTYFDETALLWDEIVVSAGMRGVQIVCSPEDLMRYVGGMDVGLV